MPVEIAAECEHLNSFFVLFVIQEDLGMWRASKFQSLEVQKSVPEEEGVKVEGPDAHTNSFWGGAEDLDLLL